MKKALVFAGLIALAGFAAIACGKAEAASSYLLVDINPSIAFVIDEDDDVESYDLLNEDAEIVAADLEFIGLSSEEAVELFLLAAVELGYIDVTRDDNVVFVTLVNEDEATEETIGERIREHVKGFMIRHRIGAVVTNGARTHEEWLALAEEHDVAPGRLRIALAASDADETLTLEEALEMPMRDLMVIVSEAHKAAMDAFRETRREHVREIHEALREEARERVREHMDALDETTREDIEARIRAARERFESEDRSAWRDAYRRRQEARNPRHEEETVEDE